MKIFLQCSTAPTITPLSLGNARLCFCGNTHGQIFRAQHPRTTRPHPCAFPEAPHEVPARAMSGFGRAPAHVSEADARASLLPTPVPARDMSSPDVDRRDEDAPLLTRDPAPGRRSEKSGPLAILRAVSTSSIVVVGGAVASLAAVILMGYSPFGISGARDQLGVESTARALQHQVVVAFQSAGYYNYHATVRLFRAAFPDKEIILVDAGDANAEVDNRHVFARSSAEGLPVDFVVEGPNVHRWRDGANACRWTVGNTVTAGWLQMIGEPQHVYQDDLWCPHARAPAVRLDTATTNLRAYDEAHTTFLWSPYSQHHLISYLGKFADRKIRHLETQPFDRPYFAAYMSSDCKSFRDDMFRALRAPGATPGTFAGARRTRWVSAAITTSGRPGRATRPCLCTRPTKNIGS